MEDPKGYLKEYLKENLRLEIIEVPNYSVDQLSFNFVLKIEDEEICSERFTIYYP